MGLQRVGHNWGTGLNWTEPFLVDEKCIHLSQVLSGDKFLYWLFLFKDVFIFNLRGIPMSPSSSAFNLSQDQGLFQWVSCLHQVSKVLELQHQSFHEYSGLISFKIDRFDLLAVQGILKSLLQHHSLKPSVLQHSTFLVQLSQHSHDYWKDHSLYCMNLCQQSDVYNI